MTKTNTIGGYKVHPAAKLFPLMVPLELDKLSEDIKENGLRQPAITWMDGKTEVLLDGRNRLLACEQAGIAHHTELYEGDDPFGFVLSHNLRRRHLGESERAMVGARLKEVLEKDRPKGRPPKESVAERPPSGERRPPVRDEAARMVNVGGRSVQKALKVIKDGTPELAAAVDAGIVKVDLAAQVADMPKDQQKAIVREVAENPKKNARSIVRRHEIDQVSERIESESADLPDGPFRVLLVDFPWAYAKRAGDGTQRGQTNYPTMTKDEIVTFAREKIAPIAHEDSVLWLCITNAHLVAGDHVDVLKAAGFTGKTMLSWDKQRMGTGDWMRGQTEHFIMAIKGRPQVRSSSSPTVLPMIEEKRREHSQKPEALYAFIEDLCPGNKVELFSRTDRLGWIPWGGEAGSLASELGL